MNTSLRVDQTPPTMPSTTSADPEVERIAGLERFKPNSEDAMRSWLEEKGVDLAQANSKKGLSDLYSKISTGEAELVYDAQTNTVYRLARVVRMDVTTTHQGEPYRMIELAQVFPDRDGRIRSAQVRDTTQLWETLNPNESDPVAAISRGLGEELGIAERDRHQLVVELVGNSRYIERPIDWPGIPSVIDEVRATVGVPEGLAPPAYFERNSQGSKLSFYVSIPDKPHAIEAITQILPHINYQPPGLTGPIKKELLVREIMGCANDRDRHANGCAVYMYGTGGGGQALHDLASLGGSSSFYSGGGFSYSTEDTATLLGYPPLKFVSSEVAEGLANAAYLKAQELWLSGRKQEAMPPRFIGVGYTAAIATNRERRGDDLVWLSVRTPDGLHTGCFHLHKRAGDEMRAKHNDAISELVLNGVASAVGASPIPVDSSVVTKGFGTNGEFTLNRVAPDNFLLERPCLVLRDGSIGTVDALTPDKYIIYPGSFRGLTAGHDLIARKAREATGKEVVLEISVRNADKGPVNRDEIARRLAGVRGRYHVVLVDKPLFTDKSRFYPRGMEFALGMDTVTRLVDPRFYDGSEEKRDAALGVLREKENRFWVLGRMMNGQPVRDVRTLPELKPHVDLFETLQGPLMDISSTLLHGPTPGK